MDTMNSSNFVDEDKSPGVGVVIFGVTLIFISLIASLGNLLVLIAIYSNASLRSMADCLLANLAVADFIQASVAIPLRMVNVFSELLIPCHIVIFFTILSGGASNMAILLVSVDRLIAIKQSLRYYTTVTPNRLLICVGFKWLIILTVAILPIAGWGKHPDKFSSGACRFTETLQRDYVVMQSVLLHVCPVLAVLLIYVVILKAACRHTKAIRAQEVCSQTRNISTPQQLELTKAVSTTSETFPSSANLQTPRSGRRSTNTPRQSRALRTVAIMVGVFIILVLPIIVIDVLEMWTGPVAPAGLVKVAICMIYTNSGVNVFIYAQSNIEYRRTFKRLLRTLWCRLRSPC